MGSAAAADVEAIDLWFVLGGFEEVETRAGDFWREKKPWPCFLGLGVHGVVTSSSCGPNGRVWKAEKGSIMRR